MADTVYLSVITPCYNGEKFIESAILSVLRQPVSGIEMIVVNDGSSDNTAEICRRYGDRIRFVDSENMGAGHARNVALDMAKGKWITYLDADDLFLPNSFTEEIFSWLESQYEAGTEVVLTPWIQTDMELSRFVRITPSEEPEQIRHIPQNEFWTGIYKRSFLQDHCVRFYEFKEQDIATAFRYRVFCLEPKTVTENNFRFLLQRDNPASNTHTWKLQTLHSVKAAVYYDLFLNYANDRSRDWLFDMAAEQMRLYYRYVQQEGIASQVQKKRMSDMVKHCLKQKEQLRRSMRNFKFIVKSAWIDLTVRKTLTIRTGAGSKPAVIRENTETVFSRMEKLTPFVRG